MSGLPQAIISLAATTSPLHRLTVYQLFIAYPDILFAAPDAGIKPRQVGQVLAGGMDDSGTSGDPIAPDGTRTDSSSLR